MKFTIKRSEWLHGIGPEKSRLYDPEQNKMCCLGFYCKARGYSLETLENQELTPLDSNHLIDGLPDKPIKFNGDILSVDFDQRIDPEETGLIAFAIVNDSKLLDDCSREQLLIKMFAKYNHEVVFED